MTIITPATIDLYNRWLAAAVADPHCSRFYWQHGYLSWQSNCPNGEWERLILVNDAATALGEISHDRNDQTVSIGVAIVAEADDDRAAAAGVVLKAIATHLWTRPVRRVFTGVAVTNEPSVRLNRHIFGEPYGIAPECAWDGACRRWVDRVLFSMSMDAFAERFRNRLS